MLKYVVEAFSQESYEDALFRAMDKASAFLSGHQSDAHVAIRSLSYSEECGYHAVLEITLVPISLRDNMHIIGIFKETQRAHGWAFRLMLKQEHEHLHHVLEEHFAKVHSVEPKMPIPDFILSPLTDVDFENHFIEKNFVHVAHPAPAPTVAVVPDSSRALSKAKRPRSGQDLEPE